MHLFLRLYHHKKHLERLKRFHRMGRIGTDDDGFAWSELMRSALDYDFALAFKARNHGIA